MDESQVSDEVVVLDQHEYEILKYNGLDALKRKSGKFGGDLEICESCTTKERLCDCYNVDLDVPSESEDSSDDEIGEFIT